MTAFAVFFLRFKKFYENPKTALLSRVREWCSFEELWFSNDITAQDEFIWLMDFVERLHILSQSGLTEHGWDNWPQSKLCLPQQPLAPMEQVIIN